MSNILQLARAKLIRLKTREQAIIYFRSPPADVRVQYGSGPFQFAELRLPKSQKPYPVIIVIHGGYWRSQYGLEHIGMMCAAITKAGYATYSVEYRRIGNPGGGFPGTFLDVGNAVDYVRLVAADYGLDLKRIVTVGHSAGGHLALWLTARRHVPPGSALQMRDPLPMSGAISLAGVVDLRRASELQLSSGAADELIGGSPKQYPERYAAASPIELLPLGVPQFLLHGEKDDTVPPEMSRNYYERAFSMGDQVSLDLLRGVGHFELIDPSTRTFATVIKAIEQAFASPARS